MDSLRSRLEALLEKEISMNNSLMSSNTPMLSEGLDVFHIETPAKLKNSLNTFKPQRPVSALPVQRSVYNHAAPQQLRNFPPKSNPPPNTINFPCFFADPTPLRLISESPLVTPLKFTRY